MAIKSAKYDIKTDTGYDTIHFQTDAKMVKILDNKKNELGNLNELGFIGKKVTTGSIKDIKTSGIYRAKGLRGMPSSVKSNEEVVLSVIATKDDNGNTSFVNYKVITQDGSIINKTIVGRVESDWSSGGTALQETVDDIRKELGNNTNLTTSSKKVVDAINELHSMIKGTDSGLNKQLKNYQSHNHDDRYIRSNANSDLTANIRVSNGAGIRMRHPNQGQDNVISVGANKAIDIGNPSTDIYIKTKGNLIHNDGKVWTSNNDGRGSGLDADTLRGSTDKDFAKVNETSTFNTMQRFKSLVEIGDIIVDGNDNSLSIGGKTIIDGNIIVNGDITQLKGDTTLGDLHFNKVEQTDNIIVRRFYGSGSSRGMGYIGYIAPSGSVNFSQAPSIQGRKLFIQPNQPSGTNHPDGSIWIS